MCDHHSAVEFVFPISHLTPEHGYPADKAAPILAHLLAEMGKVIAELNPEVTDSLRVARHCDMLGWLPDGTPVIKL